MLRPYKARVAAAVASLLFTAMATLAIGQGLSLLIDQGLSGGDGASLDRALLFLLVLGIAVASGSYIRFYLMTWLGERVVADLRNRVFEKIVQLDQSFFEITKVGEILSRLTTDTTLLQNIVGSSLSLALRNTIIIVGGLTMMIFTNPKLAAVSLLLVPIVVVPVLIIGRRVRRLSRESQDRVADVGAFAEESLNAIHTVQAYTQERRNIDRFAREVRNAFTTALVRARLRSTLTATVTIVVFFGIGAVLWVGGNDVLSGRISGGELGAFLFYAVMVSLSAGIVSEVFGELQRAAGATERLIELLETEPLIRAPSTPIPIASTPANNPDHGRVSLEDVTFHYPSRPATPAIRNFSLVAAPGETVALVGPSGAGKSSIFQLLLRFYDPADGVIRLNGVDIGRTDPVALRRELALVPQEPFIFGDTAFANIQYGDPDATEAAVQEAAKKAMADDFIRAMPDGYDSFLGERGVRLSGGQKQRISLARAILRNPTVLLLDEATSALDAENERLVQEALARLMKGRTTLVIAHRLATVVKADRIAVMNQGRIEAVGTHTELLTSSHTYKRFALLQFGEDGGGKNGQETGVAPTTRV